MTREPQRDDGDRTDDGTFASKRRSVLQGVAALGLGGSAIGTAAAENEDESKEKDREGKDGRKDDHGKDSGVPVSIQLFTLRNLPDTVPQLIQRVGATDNNGGPGYDAVEPAGLGDASASDIAEALDETGLTAPSAHIGLEQIEDNFEETVETYTEFGCDTFVVPSADSSSFESEEGVEEFAQRFNDLVPRLADEGVEIGYHNHAYEFQELDDGTAFDAFADALHEDVIFQIDVGWVLVAGHDPAEVIERHSDRVELTHMKDQTTDGAFAELGEGDVDLVEVSDVARNVADIDMHVYEHDEPESPAASVGTGAGVMSFLDGRPGLKCLRFKDVGGHDYEGTLPGLHDRK